MSIKFICTYLQQAFLLLHSLTPLAISLSSSTTGAGAGTLPGLSPTPLDTTPLSQALQGPRKERLQAIKFIPSRADLKQGRRELYIEHLQRFLAVHSNAFEFSCGVGQGGHQGKG